MSAEVFGLGFAAASFALYTWLSSSSKGTAEQLVVQQPCLTQAARVSDVGCARLIGRARRPDS